MAQPDINALFGSDSEDEDETTPATATAGQGGGKAATTQEEVDRLFDLSDDDDSDDDPAPAKPMGRLKKGGGSSGSGGRAKKRPRVDKGEGGKKKGKSGAGAADTGKEDFNQASDEYDSGDEVQETAEDRDFIASDDDNEDIRKEYEQEKQQFDDERPDKQKKKGKRAEEREEEDESNAIMKAVKDGKRKRAKEMDEKDKQVTVEQLLEKMEEACRSDRQAVEDKRPAQEKLRILSLVESVLRQRMLHETLLDYQVLSHLRDWLEPFPQEDDEGNEIPLPRRKLPNLTLRTRLYQSMAALPIEPMHLKQSESHGMGREGLGKVVMYLMKHPQETRENKLRLKKLVEDWSRLIFKKTKDYRNLKSEDQHSNYQPVVTRMPSLSRQDSNDTDGDVLASGGASQQGERDSTSARVQVPFTAGYSFKVRPTSSVEAVNTGPTGERKKKLINAMKSSSKNSKTAGGRIVKMSLEGRGAMG